ncbi:MAG: hypothetical protein GY714_00615 [Desulfobacterales bacterium]|nr:hypothetical protein [Desulfobacterales bacterium]
MSRWKSEHEQHGEKSFPGNGNPKDAELFKLKKELLDAKEQNEILKKAIAIFSQGQK